MSFPRMSLHIGDYKKDTGHLRAAGHGAYLLLIMHYWATGGLPDDDRQLAAITCLTGREWKQWKPIIRPFFGDGWRHKRIDDELIEAQKKYDARVEAGRKGGKAKANSKQNPSNTTAKTYQPITLTDTPTEKREGDAREPLVSAEAFDLSDSILKSIGADREAPDWHGFPYIVQTWLSEKIPKEFALSVCANLCGKHRNYLDKAVQNGWRDKQSEPQNPRKASNATPAKSGLAAIDRIFDQFEDRSEIPAITDENSVLSLPARSVSRP